MLGGMGKFCESKGVWEFYFDSRFCSGYWINCWNGVGFCVLTADCVRAIR